MKTTLIALTVALSTPSYACEGYLAIKAVYRANNVVQKAVNLDYCKSYRRYSRNGYNSLSDQDKLSYDLIEQALMAGLADSSGSKGTVEYFMLGFCAALGEKQPAAY